MNPKTKKIIAREGLIIIVSSVIAWLGGILFGYWGADTIGPAFFTYIIIKFIIWAVKTLKEK